MPRPFSLERTNIAYADSNWLFIVMIWLTPTLYASPVPKDGGYHKLLIQKRLCDAVRMNGVQ
jgi:hypothetical protein